MLRDVVAAEPLAGYRLRLRFDDGVEGIVDIRARVPFDGVFTLLRDPDYFCRVKVDPELGTVVWPNGADLDPTVLYRAVTGKPLPDWEEPEPPADTPKR